MNKNHFFWTTSGQLVNTLMSVNTGQELSTSDLPECKGIIQSSDPSVAYIKDVSVSFHEFFHFI